MISRLAVFAAVLAVVVIVAIVYLRNLQMAVHSDTPHGDLRPGSDKAVLTLSTGRALALSAKDGSILQDSGVGFRTHGAELSYIRSRISVTHSLSTPRGGQYRLVLPDGTRVWLNAASSITYPTAFLSNKRSVSIVGEAYFEVAKDTLRPFVVKTYREPVETREGCFNVNSYTDEPVIRVSLVKGSAHVHSYVLQPGQGYAFGDLIAANPRQDMAWTTGRFGFDHTDIQVILRQVARWYDTEISCPDGVRVKWITGQMPRDLPAGELIAALNRLGIHAEVRSGQIVILL